MIPVRQPLTKENIFNKISSYDIFKTYCDNFEEIDKKFKSDLRPDDKNPSCCIAYINGDLLYTDFGEGSYRAVSYVMKKFNLRFGDALLKINKDFKLELGSPYVLEGEYIRHEGKKLEKIKFKEKKDTVIRIKQRDFTKKDLEYWYQYGWTLDMLKKAKIKSIAYYWLDNHKNNNRLFPVGYKNLCFSYEYYFHKSIFRRKLYLPESEVRFLSNVDNTVVQGYHLLPKEGGDVLFITKSYKDCGAFWNCGFNAIAPNTEEAFLPSEYIYKLKNRFKRIILWFDNDKTGIKRARDFSEQFKFEYYHTPINTEKDPTDVIKNSNGKIDKFKQLLYGQIQNLPKNLSPLIS